MDAKTLEALKASIAKWERNAEAKTPADVLYGAEACRNCFTTPYHNVVARLHDWKRTGARSVFDAAARDEVAFLKSLLPGETP